MTEFSEEARKRLEEYLKTHHLPRGLGNKEEACSVAAINLALTGELTDRIPDCMSLVIGRWIIRTQDSLPDDMRNSGEWKSLLVRAAGTGRNHEQERRQLILDWLWGNVVVSARPYAVKIGLELEWDEMIERKTWASANKVRTLARQKYAVAVAVAVAADVAVAAAVAVAVAAAADADAADADADAADAAVAAVAAAAAAVAARRKTWESFKPYELLESLIEIGQEQTND